MSDRRARLVVYSDDGRRVEPELFDCEPSFAILQIIYPSASIFFDGARDCWFVTLPAGD